MKKFAVEILQAATVAAVFALPFIFYFASMKP
jgi:hypothetical protein